MRIRIEAQLDVRVQWDEPASVFVSYAPALDIYSQGPTHDYAIRAIEGAMRMYLITALEMNKLDVVLKRFAERSSGIGPKPLSSDQYIKVLPDGGHHIKAKLIPSEIQQG